MNTISIEVLAEKLGGKLWEKGDLKRIYLDKGFNTKKMSTKTYVYQRESGDFAVSCYVECASQPYQWCQSQAQEVIDNVTKSIDHAVWEFENPEKAFHKKEGENHFPYGKRVRDLFNGFYDRMEAAKANAGTENVFKPTIKPDDSLTIVPVAGEMFGTGTKVKHSRFGLGIVIDENTDKVTINFDEVGEKCLVKKFVSLLKIA